ncbi:hypothetical protein U3516DRAFT_919673 [Neocallimastix sp. 'constans']|jgi:hypothetical protein
MEFNKIINSNNFLIRKISQSYQQHLLGTLKNASFQKISNIILSNKILLNQVSTHSFHSLSSFSSYRVQNHQNIINFFPTSSLSIPSSFELIHNSLYSYTPFYRKEHFRILSLFSKDEEIISEKVIHHAKNDILAPPLTKKQKAKHEREKEIYQKIRKFEHYNYFRSISKPSYYDTLKIDEEDKNLTFFDKLIHRYFKNRRIQTKYSGRNLNRGFVYVSPEREAEKTTTICDCSTDKSPRELMVLLGWWNCHPKHLRKYIKLYSNLGYPVLAHISPTLLLVVPKILNIKNEHLMKQMFQFWKENLAKGQEFKIMFHTFSDNGSYIFAHFTYVLQVNIRKYRKKMKNKETLLLKNLNLSSLTINPSPSSILTKLSLPLSSAVNEINHASGQYSAFNAQQNKENEITEDQFIKMLKDMEKEGKWEKGDKVSKLVDDYRQAKKDYDDYEAFFYCMEAAIMDSGPSLLTQSVITRGITAGITSMKCMKYLGIKSTNYSPKLSKMICYFYYIYVRQPSIAKYLLDIYYPAFYNVPKHMAYMFMYGNGDRVICPDLIEPYIYNLQKNGFLVRRAYFEGSDHVMHYVVHREVYESEVRKFIHDIREHSRIESKSGSRVIYDEKTGIIQDHEKILIPDKQKGNIKSIWARAKSDEEHFLFLGIIPKTNKTYRINEK